MKTEAILAAVALTERLSRIIQDRLRDDGLSVQWQNVPFPFIEADIVRPSLILAQSTQTMPQITQIRRHIQRDGRPCPLMVIGHVDDDDDRVITFIRDGADDYLRETQIATLTERIRKLLQDEDVQPANVVEAWNLNFFESFPLPMNILDIETAQVVYANPAAVELLGEQRMDRLVTLTNEDGQHKIQEDIELARRGITPPNREYRVHMNGREMTMIVYRMLGTYSGRPAIVSIYPDVAELVRMGSALRQSENRFQTALDHIPYAVVLHDAEGRIIFVNQRGARSNQRPAEEIIGKRIEELYPGGEASCMQQTLAQVYATGETRTRICTSQLPVGVMEFSITYIPLFNKMGELVEVLGISHNLAEQRKAEQQAAELALERTRAQLLNEFILNTSHELRTPLAIITSNLGMLQRDESEQARIRRTKQIAQNVQNLVQMIEQLHRMAEYDHVDKIDTETLNVGNLLQQHAARYKPKDVVSILTDVPDEALFVQGNADLLHDALAQLMENAQRWTARGRITLSAEAKGDYVAITVEDTGIGIHPDILPRIFDRMFKANNARTPDGSGMGLGLAMVRRIAELHSGRVAAESKLHQGTKITLLIPAADDAATDI